MPRLVATAHRNRGEDRKLVGATPDPGPLGRCPPPHPSVTDSPRIAAQAPRHNGSSGRSDQSSRNPASRPNEVFSLSALGGSLPDGPRLLTATPGAFLERMGYQPPLGTRAIRTELLPEPATTPLVVPMNDPPGLAADLAQLFRTLRRARDTNTLDLPSLTDGAIQDPSQVRYAEQGEIILALPMVADLAARIGLDHTPTPLGRAHRDEIKSPGRIRILPDVEVLHTPTGGLLAIRNGRSLALGKTSDMRRIVEHLAEASQGATPAEIADLTPDAILNETIAAWLVRNGVAGRATKAAPHHRHWLKAGATPHGADEATRLAPTFDASDLPAQIAYQLRTMRLRCASAGSARIEILRDGFSPTALQRLEEATRLQITTIPVFRSAPDRILIGPWLHAQGQPCPRCWHRTLREAAVRPDLTMPLEPARIPDTLPEAIGLYLAKHLIGLDRRRIVFSLHVGNGALTKHTVIPDPACAQCGAHKPAAPPEPTGPIDVTKLPGLVDPVTGPLGAPRGPPLQTDTDPALRATLHVAFAAFTRPGLHEAKREFAAGKGRTREGAQAGALAEALERRSMARPPSHILHALREPDHPGLAGPMLETNDVDLYGPEQRPGHVDDTSVHPHNRRLPAPQPRDRRPLVRLSRLDGSPGPWIEAARVCGLPETDRTYPAARCSNGLAAGPTIEQAIFRAFAELVERDATALWWYSMCRRPAIPLDALGASREHALLAARGLRAVGRDLAVLDLRTNPVLPAVAAVSFQGDTRPMIGLGASATHATAAARAIAEIGQNLDFATGTNRLAHRDPLRRAISRLTRSNAPWLCPRGVERTLVHAPIDADPISLVRRTSEEMRVESYWIDLTDRRFPLPVARVFAPGLRHFWRRTAPGRLYTEPYRLGWTNEPLALRGLNRLELLI